MFRMFNTSWYHRTIRLSSSHLFPYLEGILRILYKVLSMRRAYQSTIFLFKTFPHTQTLSSLSLVILLFWTLSLTSSNIWLSHLLTLDHVNPGLLLILPKSNLVIYTSQYLLSTLLYYTSLRLGLVVSNPAIGLWCMDHVVTVYIVEPLGSYYPKLDLLLYPLK